MPFPVQTRRTMIDQPLTAKTARTMREAQGLSLREVSRRMGISAPYLSDLELGRRLWSAALCEAFERAIGQAA